VTLAFWTYRKVRFRETRETALCYATSIHKSQGSEYSAVVIPLSTVGTRNEPGGV
jgi:ATP-dependent exoDNAse (exonuclease V) alpha subunit